MRATHASPCCCRLTLNKTGNVTLLSTGDGQQLIGVFASPIQVPGTVVLAQVYCSVNGEGRSQLRVPSGGCVQSVRARAHTRSPLTGTHLHPAGSTASIKTGGSGALQSDGTMNLPGSTIDDLIGAGACTDWCSARAACLTAVPPAPRSHNDGRQQHYHHCPDEHDCACSWRDQRPAL